MCGRYTIRRIDTFIRHGAMEPPPFEEFDERAIVPRFNAAPGQLIPVIRLNAHDVMALALVKWGLIPHFNKTKPNFAPINARSDTILELPMYRQAIARRRALVPADGFYEPKKDQTTKKGTKNDQYFFRFKDDRAFAMAAIWERWANPATNDNEDTVAIITTEPNTVVAPIHHRMPVIVERKDYSRWLDRNVPAAGVTDIMVPYHDPDAMECWKVSLLINKPENEGPDCIARI